MSISRATRTALVLASTAVITAGLAAPAQAATTSRTASCSAGGFTGYMRVTFDLPSFSGTTVRSVEYRIVKGSNRGGNKADVSWFDGGVAPTLVSSTAGGIQDGAWHTLRSADYGRGSGAVSGDFIFDKSNAGDPRCLARF